jgi:hypothetical protein
MYRRSMQRTVMVHYQVQTAVCIILLLPFSSAKYSPSYLVTATVYLLILCDVYKDTLQEQLLGKYR